MSRSAHDDEDPTRSPRPGARTYRGRPAEDGDIAPDEAAALLEWGTTLDGEKVAYTYRDGERQVVEFPPTSITSHLAGLRLTATEDVDLLDATAESFNAAMETSRTSVGFPSRITPRCFW